MCAALIQRRPCCVRSAITCGDSPTAFGRRCPLATTAAAGRRQLHALFARCRALRLWMAMVIQTEPTWATTVTSLCACGRAGLFGAPICDAVLCSHVVSERGDAAAAQRVRPLPLRRRGSARYHSLRLFHEIGGADAAPDPTINDSAALSLLGRPLTLGILDDPELQQSQVSGW